METDASTLQDLSIIHPDDAQSILKKIDYCRTEGGRKKFLHLITHPHKTIRQIRETEEVLKAISSFATFWPEQITNGTIQMIDQFYAYPLGNVPKISVVAVQLYRLINRNEYAMLRFSLNHYCDFLKGMKELADLLKKKQEHIILKNLSEEICVILEKQEIRRIVETEKDKLMIAPKILQYGNFLYNQFRQSFQKLKDIYIQLDAWHSMVVAMQKNQMVFPEWVDSASPEMEVGELRHLLLEEPVGYQFNMSRQSNFMFLTGANMAGKSTFIKAVGAAVYLAHTGMGVPASSMKLSLFDGIISNIQIQDNISKGESFFFNEVQRIKSTISKIKDGRRCLVLIDELFKGTNIQDAMLCSKTVIDGFVCAPKSLFILSTHLYEIGEELTQYPNILFRYFETIGSEDHFSFSYQLKEGISQDRFGYLILKKEKVTDMLQEMITTHNKKIAP
jgi:DNA mismatch repair ATPase MutS